MREKDRVRESRRLLVVRALIVLLVGAVLRQLNLQSEPGKRARKGKRGAEKQEKETHANKECSTLGF